MGEFNTKNATVGEWLEHLQKEHIRGGVVHINWNEMKMMYDRLESDLAEAKALIAEMRDVLEFHAPKSDRARLALAKVREWEGK